MKSTHLFNYQYDGSTYSFGIKAHSKEEAEQRVQMLQFATYKGVQVFEGKLPKNMNSPMFKFKFWLLRFVPAFVNYFKGGRFNMAYTTHHQKDKRG